ncbi:hypothetical protein G5V59_20815 [Nocardioides sp. W3-2-3]|uniref:hypothetical protein n=1 Tax=Nocardioides convexus TaxID=2712224 RepID=UPI002418A571|nr:hypothetical protein [Nocardioides convexus]NHA01441.1 hypothetical protein [Nocardioides convexus]
MALTSADQPDCGPLLAQVTTVLTRLRADPHAFDLATPRPVACQVLSSAGLSATGDDATACTSGTITAWILDASTHPDDVHVALGAVRGTRSRQAGRGAGPRVLQRPLDPLRRHRGRHPRAHLRAGGRRRTQGGCGRRGLARARLPRPRSRRLTRPGAYQYDQHPRPKLKHVLFWRAWWIC